MSLLETALTYLPGVGPKRAAVLASELGLYTYQDLLLYFPTKYVDRSRTYQIRELRGELPSIQLRGYIRDYKELGEGRKKRLVAYFTDGTGTIELTWFRSLATIRRLYPEGRMFLVFGKPVAFAGGYSITHPELDDVEKEQAVGSGLMPVYPLTDAVRRVGLASRQMRQLLYTLKELLRGQLTEPLPASLLRSAQLMPYAEALEQIHFPETRSCWRRHVGD